MKVQIYHFNQKSVKDVKCHERKLVHDIVATHLGYAEVYKFDAEYIWNLCNWSHWAEVKPENLHSNINSCGHGLCLINPETQERYLALSNGWLIGDEKQISDYVFKHRYDLIWD